MRIFFLKFRFYKPALRKLLCAISHIHTAKDAEREHFLWCELGLEPWVKVSPRRFAEFIAIPSLHLVVNEYGFLFHGLSLQMISLFFVLFELYIIIILFKIDSKIYA